MIFQIFAVDARNHGDSPHTEELTYNHLAEDLRALMNDLAVKRATFIGHSMGGRAIMLLGLRYVSIYVLGFSYGQYLIEEWNKKYTNV